MSFNSKCKIDGTELNLNVQSINYNFHGSTNDRGERTSDMFSGGVTVVFEVAEDASKFTKWAFDMKRTRKFGIDFTGIKDGNQEVKSSKVEMEDAYLSSYNFSFSRSGDVNTLLTVHITAPKIKVGGEEYDASARYA
jgi:hypothetical protein